MESQSISIELNSAIRLYVFGSFLTSPAPNDIDVLFQYDHNQVGPSEVDQMIESIINNLSIATGLRVHPMVLSIRECEQTAAIERFGCVPFETLHLTGLAADTKRG